MKRIFDGIRVVDFTNNVAGPVAVAMLADHGAEVIKIERPVAGDDSRSSVPPYDNGAIQNIWYNRGKKSIEVDLHDTEVQEVLLKIIETADVVVESFKPGQIKKFNLDYESVKKVNPDVIYMSVSACGQTGKYSNEPGFDVIVQGTSGLMDLCGEPDGQPVKFGIPIGDYVASYNGFGALAAALYHKERTGEGQYIDLSLLDGLLYCNTYLDMAATLDKKMTRNGNHHATAAPYGVYKGKNGQSAIIATPAPAAWSRLCNAMGRSELIDDERFKNSVLRVANLKELVDEIEGWLKSFDEIDEAIDILKSANVPCGKIKTTYEVAHDEALWENGSLIEIPTPTSFKARTFKGRAHPVRYSATPAILGPAPDLGEHTYEILTEFGWTKKKIDDKLMQWRNKK